MGNITTNEITVGEIIAVFDQGGEWSYGDKKGPQTTSEVNPLQMSASSSLEFWGEQKPKRLARYANRKGVRISTQQIREAGDIRSDYPAWQERVARDIFLELAGTRVSRVFQRVLTGMEIDIAKLEPDSPIRVSALTSLANAFTYNEDNGKPDFLDVEAATTSLRELGLDPALIVPLKPRKEVSRLSSVEEKLIAQARRAADIYRAFGGAYGFSDKPSFRIATEPVQVEMGIKDQLTILSNDIALFASKLNKLPSKYKKQLGLPKKGFVPFFKTRLDIILTPEGRLKVVECQDADGADGLMILEQLMYEPKALEWAEALKQGEVSEGLIEFLDGSTAGAMLRYLEERYADRPSVDIVYITDTRQSDPYYRNYERIVEFLALLSEAKYKGKFRAKLIERTDPVLQGMSAEVLMNNSSLTPTDIAILGIMFDLGVVAEAQTALGNKGSLALLYDESLETFWVQELGQEVFGRLKESIPETRFVRNEKELRQYLKRGYVIKTYQAKNSLRLSQSKGVIFADASEFDIDKFVEEFKKGEIQIVAQEMVESRKYDFTVLSSVKGKEKAKKSKQAGRMCVTLVAKYGDNPSAQFTAGEVTLGKPPLYTGDCVFDPFIFI